MWPPAVRQLIEMAFAEDLADIGDVTSALVPDRQKSHIGRIIARESGIVCGIALISEILGVFRARYSKATGPEPLVFGQGVVGNQRIEFNDGDVISDGDRLGAILGSAAEVLQIERTLLNFLQRMSGVATLTRRYVDAACTANPNVQVCDTRKTIPGWRALDKYAVRCGGGTNHREGLFDAVLIKDNHLALLPPKEIEKLLPQMLVNRPAAAKFVEVEVDSLDQFDAVCTVPGVDMILLDNFTLPMLREAVKRRSERGLGGRVQLEASGGVTLSTIPDIAATGVDRISVGAITHSAPALDIALDF